MILPVSQTSLYLPPQLCTNGAYHCTSFLVSAISKKNWLCSLYLQMLLLCANCGYQGMSNMTECNPILTPFAVMHLL